MTQEQQQQFENELKEAGWTPLVEPNKLYPQCNWLAPDDGRFNRLYPGPGYAWFVMTEEKSKNNQHEQKIG